MGQKKEEGTVKPGLQGSKIDQGTEMGRSW